MNRNPDKLRVEIDRSLLRILRAGSGFPGVIYCAARYSVAAGGKRIRPLLTLLSGRVCGLKPVQAMSAACAVEMIHTYSLIHDDLPAMDDDDYRRGKPTCHKKFGEANAILAGDALLTKAFETMLSVPAGGKVRHGQVLKAAVYMAKAAGIEGMVGGQAADVLYEGKRTGKKLLAAIHSRKTGALIRAAVVVPALLSGAAPGKLKLWAGFGEKIGLAFQVADDILDVTATSKKLGKTAGKDARVKKATYPAVYGLEKSRKIAAKLALEAKLILCKINGDTKELEKLVDFIIGRSY